MTEAGEEGKESQIAGGGFCLLHCYSRSPALELFPAPRAAWTHSASGAAGRPWASHLGWRTPISVSSLWGSGRRGIFPQRSGVSYLPLLQPV